MRSGDDGRLEFLGLTSVALRAPCVSPKNSKSVYDAPGTKCIGWIGTHRDSSRPSVSLKPRKVRQSALTTHDCLKNERRGTQGG